MKLHSDTISDFREHRHEFLLHYYNMAVEDLSRHLNIGWQSIAVAGGAVAAVSLGYEGKLPQWLSVTFAIAVLSWGLQNVLDSNHWAVRAIAFLANVEAHYLTEEDRPFTNQYMGFHPPWKLMNSLRAQFLTICVLALSTLVYYANWLRTVYPWESVVDAGQFMSAADLFGPLFPVPITVACLIGIVSMGLSRVERYREFVEQSPGPPTFETVHDLEEYFAGNSVVLRSGDERQKGSLQQARDVVHSWRKYRNVSLLVAAVVLIWAGITIASSRPACAQEGEAEAGTVSSAPISYAG